MDVDDIWNDDDDWNASDERLRDGEPTQAIPLTHVEIGPPISASVNAVPKPPSRRDNRRDGRQISVVATHTKAIQRLCTALLVVAVLSGIGAVWVSTRQSTRSAQAAPVPTVPFSMGSRTSVEEGVVSLPVGGVLGEEVQVLQPVANPSSEPMTVSVPDLGIEAPMVETDIVDNELIIPDDVRKVTRYVGGAAPGDPTGTVLIAGHVNSRRMGRGALFPLAGIEPGTVITVNDAKGAAHRYVTVGLITTGKDTLPADIFSKEGEPRLVMITCGGPLLRTATGGSSYRDNVIVTARPLPA